MSFVEGDVMRHVLATFAFPATGFNYNALTSKMILQVYVINKSKIIKINKFIRKTKIKSIRTKILIRVFYK
jgi:hypothetical protein